MENTISIPLVITKEDNEFHGFTPGIIMTDIICSDMEECLNRLEEFVKEEIYNYAKNNSQMPFFPDNDEILEDFKDVIHIKRIAFVDKV